MARKNNEGVLAAAERGGVVAGRPEAAAGKPEAAAGKLGVSAGKLGAPAGKPEAAAGKPPASGEAPAPHVYGYARVSHQDQNLARQYAALEAAGVARGDVFADRASGRNFDRPAWRALLAVLRPGDVVFVESIDRLGRCYADILDQWRQLTRGMGAAVVVLDMPLLDTRRTHCGVAGELISDITLQLLSYVAQVERENILARQAEGIACAKARGVRLGRPPMELPEEWPAVRDMFLAGEATRAQAAALLGVGTTTFDKWRSHDPACGKAHV